MAINRALMNRQMYNMGGPSLQAGAPDITLTGDMRPTYSAMRKQRMAFGGIAGLDGRKKYGIGSWFQENIMDPIKDNPITSAVIGGGLVNQFGLPDSITKYLFDGAENVGQNFLGDLISKVPGSPVGIDTVFGDTGEFTKGASGTDLSSYLKSLVGLENAGVNPGTSDDGYIIGGGFGGNQKEGMGFETILDSAGENITTQAKNALQQALGIPQTNNQPNTSNMTGPQKGQLELEKYKRRNLNADLVKALGIGTAAGAYVDSQPKDVLPTDTTGINFQTAQQVLDDPNQRFKPPVEATQLAAEGGRIGYNMGGDVDTLVASYMKSPEGQQELMSKANEGMGMPEIVDQMKQELMMAQASSQENMPMQQPNRMMAAEGGLMDLGGMEKDYREDGGFVPIGGQEKADDVPARLSKNEFVFTADAVRNAGGGDIDQGAQVMEKLMRNLESGGQVSEESQGLEGAREMFETSQRLEKRII